MTIKLLTFRLERLQRRIVLPKRPLALPPERTPAQCSVQLPVQSAPDKQKHKLATRSNPFSLSLSFSGAMCLSRARRRYHSRRFSFFSYLFARKHATGASETAAAKERMCERGEKERNRRGRGRNAYRVRTNERQRGRKRKREKETEGQGEREKRRQGHDATRRREGGTRRE